MAEYHASSAYGGNAYPGGSRQPARGYDNSAKEYPTSISETASTYSQGSRSENSAPTIPGMEHLSINSRLSGPEHIDAADFYRFHSQQPNANWRQENTTPGPASVSARSKAQMLMLGMEYMEPYIEAYDNLWKSDESNMRTKIKENLSVPGGKLFAETSQGLSPVTIFTSLGKTELVAILLHEGVDINDAPGGRGKPLGHAVAWLGNDDLVEMLLAAGADPNSATDRGVTALHVAVSVGNIKAVKQLVNAGADIDAKLVNFGGVHSLPVFSKLRDSHMATYGKIIDFLVESGASTDLHDTTQWTPLQYICISGSVELVRRLTEIGVPKEPLVALRKLVASDWVMSGYYKNWEIRLEEDA
ncbi:hypothetical protein TWF703_001703 [Orbilia oligospora]|uniref:Uncharacterized protein n=1 Tax=Orbilia oligospora TaxID=2813651 RepID=A0A7C8P1S8_ORBOL|nr:hypothetical protein TWF703_001703 [Orbilia oligospora]